jgi:hypothetical protein
MRARQGTHLFNCVVYSTALCCCRELQDNLRTTFVSKFCERQPGIFSLPPIPALLGTGNLNASAKSLEQRLNGVLVFGI